MEPKDVYMTLRTDRAPGTSDFTLEGDKVPMGRVVRVETFIAIDFTTAAKKVRLGIKRGQATTWLKRETLGTNIHEIALDNPLILVGGEQPVGMIESPTNKDVCTLLARGPYL